jgi:hypothetical protein
LPTTIDAAVEIEFQHYGPNEHLCLIVEEKQIPLADVDVDDVRVPLFPLRDLPDVAARLHGEIAQAYGALLLYKLTSVAQEDDLNALASILCAALPPGLFARGEQARIIEAERRAWQVQQRRPLCLRVIDHPMWRQLLGASG